MPDFKSFFSFIASKVDLSSKDYQLIKELGKTKTYDKGDIIEQPGKNCTQLQFVLSGVFRVYVLENGKEITKYFS